MANLGPKQMWFGKNGTGAPVFTTSNSDYGVSMSKGGEGAKAFNQLKADLIAVRDDENYYNYGPEIKGVTDYSVGSYSTLLGTPKKATAKNKNGDIAKFNTTVRLIHEAMWTGFII